jgi:hypothetical protein
LRYETLVTWRPLHQINTRIRRTSKRCYKENSLGDYNVGLTVSNARRTRAFVRSVKRLAETYPVGYMEAARRGQPLVLYRTDNEVSSNRAQWLCQAGNKRVEECGLPWSRLPPKPQPQQTGWWRSTAAPGAIAAAYKLMLQRGEEPTLEAIAKFFDGVPFHEGPLDVSVPPMLAELHARGDLDRIRAEVDKAKPITIDSRAL